MYEDNKYVHKLTYEEILAVHENGSLVGFLKLFPDNTECYIEEDDWENIQDHLRNGGEIGIEK